MVPVIIASTLIQQSLNFDVEFSNRLAMTPKLDGEIVSEEWDHLADFAGTRSYFQWEPGKFYVAADTPAANGIRVWLRSTRNPERVLQLVVDQTDGLNEARAWVQTGETLTELRDYAQQIQIAVHLEGERARFELSLPQREGFSASSGAEYEVRVEPAEGLNPAESMNSWGKVRLAMERSVGLPSGVEWNPQVPIRSVPPGEEILLRMNFRKSADWNPIRIQMHSIGDASDVTPSTDMPFPDFDRKNRAFVDYKPRIQNGTPVQGYTVMVGRIVDDKGRVTVVQTSYEIAPIIKIEAGKPEIFLADDGSLRVFIDVTVRSTTKYSVKGDLQIETPPSWQVTRGNNSRFLIYHARGSARVRLELRGPISDSDVPVVLRAEIGDQVFKDIEFIRYTK